MHRPATRRFVMWSLDVRSVRVVSSLLGSLSVSLARRAVVSRPSRVSAVARRVSSFLSQNLRVVSSIR